MAMSVSCILFFLKSQKDNDIPITKICDVKGKNLHPKQPVSPNKFIPVSCVHSIFPISLITIKMSTMSSSIVVDVPSVGTGSSESVTTGTQTSTSPLSGATGATIGMVVDRSGSMASVADDAVGGMNVFIDGQRATGASFSVMLFDDRFVFPNTGKEYSKMDSEILASIPLVSASDMRHFESTSKAYSTGYGYGQVMRHKVMEPVPEDEAVEEEFWDYTPRGGTALVDAMGYMINRLDRCEGQKIMVVQTDGHENQSREFTASDIKTMISERQKRLDWQFFFLGADESAISTATHSYGIGKGHCLKYGKAKKSNQVWQTCSQATARAQTYGCTAAAYGGSCFDDEERLEADSD